MTSGGSCSPAACDGLFLFVKLNSAHRLVRHYVCVPWVLGACRSYCCASIAQLSLDEADISQHQVVVMLVRPLFLTGLKPEIGHQHQIRYSFRHQCHSAGEAAGVHAASAGCPCNSCRVSTQL